MKTTSKLIEDVWVEDALQYLATSTDQTASARANRVRAEFTRKRTKANLILRSPESSVAMRDAWAEAHGDYKEACDQEVAAIEADEWHRAQRNKCDTIIEAWRSEQANQRAGNKFQ